MPEFVTFFARAAHMRLITCAEAVEVYQVSKDPKLGAKILTSPCVRGRSKKLSSPWLSLGSGTPGDFATISPREAITNRYPNPQTTVPDPLAPGFKNAGALGRGNLRTTACRVPHEGCITIGIDRLPYMRKSSNNQ